MTSYFAMPIDRYLGNRVLVDDERGLQNGVAEKRGEEIGK